MAATVAAVAAAGVLVVPAAPAYAAASPPLAFGQAERGDTNVLAVDGTVAGTEVRVRPYRVGAAADVASQRWIFEAIPAGSGIPAQTFRIRNAAANRCLEKPLSEGDVDGAGVVIADCLSVTHQYWYIPTDYPIGGYDLRSVRDGRCVDLFVSNDGAPIMMFTCSSFWNTQKWKVRYGAFDCNERVVTALCARPGQPIFGLFATWRHYPMTFQGPDFNSAYNYLGFETLDFTSPSDRFDYLEVGWRGRYDADIGETGHDAYWLEQGLRNGEYFYQEYSLAGRPGGADANGRNHAYMALVNDDETWDILYDYNPVGTTVVGTGDRLKYLETGLMPQYEEQLSLATPFENRIQFLDGNNVWRRPRLGEASALEQNTCDAPPTMLSWGRPNTPPWCFVPTLATRAGASGPEVDYYSVAKPGAAPAAPAPAAPTGAPGVHNGVDQRALTACMAADASRCLKDVPGLAQCVAARRVCNLAARGADLSALRDGARAMTLAEAQTATRSTLSAAKSGGAAPVTPSRAATTSVRKYAAATGAQLSHLPPTDEVHVISGEQVVTGMRGREVGTYRGYVLAFHAGSGVLLHACLGPACRRP